jgi:SNF2 family DNA or RNA helicase
LINKKSVEAFLKRKLENHTWLKSEPPANIRANLAEDFALVPGLKNLWNHQLVGYLLTTTLKRFMLHIEMGGGKTSTVLFSILYRKMKGEKPQAIIFVPYVTAVDTWIEECKLRTPLLKLVALIGTTTENLRRLEERDGDVFVICYASAVAMLSEKHPKGGWLIDPKRTRKVFKGFDTFVADEIHRCSSVTSLTYRMCRTISEGCTYGIGLSGTPFGKDIEDIWSQFYLIDFGDTLGATKGLFQEAFFTKKQNFFTKFDEYKFDKAKLPLLNKFIKHSSIHYAASEMNDLPPQRYIKRQLALPTAMAGYVSNAAASFIEAINEAANGPYGAIEASYLQLRQLASGFMTVDGETDKIKVAFDTNPKLDLLEEYLDAMPLDSKMVVFHHFVYTNSLISGRLTKLKIKHARIWSGQKNIIGELKRFRDDANCKVLVLNDQSGSSSLNLQHANYCFWFEQPDSPINRQQGEARVWRSGQTKPVTYIDPFMEGTVDERIYYSNKSGKKLLDELLKGKEKL